LEIPAAFVFPNLLACLHCGFTEFLIAESELQRLRCVVTSSAFYFATNKFFTPAHVLKGIAPRQNTDDGQSIIPNQ
jgi:hypothetical protein